MAGCSHFTLPVYVFILSGFLIVSCSALKNVKKDIVGSWNYTVNDTPEGDVSGVFNINRIKGEYIGTFNMEDMLLDMQDLTIEDNKISCFILIQGYRVDFYGEFNDDTFSGSSSLDDSIFMVEAVKVK